MSSSNGNMHTGAYIWQTSSNANSSIHRSETSFHHSNSHGCCLKWFTHHPVIHQLVMLNSWHFKSFHIINQFIMLSIHQCIRLSLSTRHHLFICIVYESWWSVTNLRWWIDVLLDHESTISSDKHVDSNEGMMFSSNGSMNLHVMSFLYMHTPIYAAQCFRNKTAFMLCSWGR